MIEVTIEEEDEDEGAEGEPVPVQLREPGDPVTAALETDDEEED